MNRNPPEASFRQKRVFRIKGVSLLLILCLFTLIICFAFCWQPGFLDDDSVAYAQTAKLVADSNRWLVFNDPSYGGKFYYHFPLVIWVTAIIFKVFGVSVLSASIFSLLSSLASVIVIFYFGKLIKDKWVGFFASTLFLLINFTPRLARQCRMDMPLTLFIILSMYYFSKAAKAKKINYLLFGLFAGLAILAKDVFGLAPLVIAVIFLLISRRFKDLFNPYFILSFVLAFAPVIFWIWLEQRLYGETTFNKWLNWNFLNLLKGSVFNTPFYYYPLEVVKRYSYFAPFFVYGSYLALRKFLNKESSLPLLILIWALFIPFAFSFGRQKLHYFVYSMYPAWALLAALAIDRLFKESQKQIIFYLLIFAIGAFGLLQLCTPVRVGKVYFSQAIKLAPIIDGFLENIGPYDFYTFIGQDDTALIFYSKRLKNTVHLKDAHELIVKLSEKNPTKIRFCLLDRQDFDLARPNLPRNWRILLKAKDRLLITDRPAEEIPIVLPN